MSEWQVHGNVSMSFSAIIEAESEDAAIAIAEKSPVEFFIQSLEEGDEPAASDIEVEFANPWRDGR